MKLESYYFNEKNGKIHIKLSKSPNSKLPFVLFLHGASPKSQHTGFWSSILDKILPYCNPVLMDRFGHGSSEIESGVKIGVKEHLNSIIQIIDHILERYKIEHLILIGRSQGGGYATRIAKEFPKKISALGLIAPGGMKTNYKNLEAWQKPTSLLWDIDDPIAKFENYQFAKGVLDNPMLFTIGKSDEKSQKTISRDQAKKSHIPELMAPELFELFLKSLIHHSPLN